MSESLARFKLLCNDAKTTTPVLRAVARLAELLVPHGDALLKKANKDESDSHELKITLHLCVQLRNIALRELATQ